jgi:hypothetical protein
MFAVVSPSLIDRYFGLILIANSGIWLIGLLVVSWLWKRS